MAKENKSRKKKKLGSYPYLSVLFSITLSLFVIGLFGLVMLHTQKLTSLIQENVEMQVFLDREISEGSRIQIQKALSAKDYTNIKDGEVMISYVSKEQAAQDFIDQTGEDFSKLLDDNPLRSAYILNIKPEFQSDSTMSEIKTEIELMAGVFEADYDPNLIESINKNLTTIGLVLLTIAVLSLIVVVILINNTIKLALFSQRFLIRSMQLVGAKASFIKRPFLTRAGIYGMLAGILASCGLYALMQFFNSLVENLSTLQNNTYIYILFGILLILGAIIGLGSTHRAISKYLKMTLDQLY